MMDFEQEQVWNKLNNIDGNWYSQVDNEEEREEFRNWVKGILKTAVLVVTFTKADGAEREMKCTLSEDCGAKYVVNENKESTKKPNPHVCVVWDCEQNAWRSFRYDRIKTIGFTLG
jgi:hypothetical protein